MNPEINSQESEIKKEDQEPSVLNSVTPLSKYLALFLFVTLPFLGGWIGYTYAPVKTVEIEVPVTKESLDQDRGLQTPGQNILSEEISPTPSDKLVDDELFPLGWSQGSETILINDDPMATIEHDFPGSSLVIYQTRDKSKTFFTLDDSEYYYTSCMPLYYLNLNERKYNKFLLDYCPTDGMGVGIKNYQDVLPLVLQYGKMGKDLYMLNFETEQEVSIFSMDSLASNESLTSICTEGNYVFQKIPDIEVVGKTLRIGIYEKDPIDDSCTSEKQYKKLRDVIIEL